MQTETEPSVYERTSLIIQLLSKQIANRIRNPCDLLPVARTEFDFGKPSSRKLGKWSGASHLRA